MLTSQESIPSLALLLPSDAYDVTSSCIRNLMPNRGGRAALAAAAAAAAAAVGLLVAKLALGLPPVAAGPPLPPSVAPCSWTDGKGPEDGGPISKSSTTGPTFGFVAADRARAPEDTGRVSAAGGGSEIFLNPRGAVAAPSKLNGSENGSLSALSFADIAAATGAGTGTGTGVGTKSSEAKGSKSLDVSSSLRPNASNMSGSLSSLLVVAILMHYRYIILASRDRTMVIAGFLEARYIATCDM
mmetsp:Transcript_2323/g.4941  ORF Transcript_2323/g.4941 Transcript_2323/m.4941 type:complete len:243 (-) Transcript_2323:2-730(-)